jgi:hypothetical protein
MLAQTLRACATAEQGAVGVSQLKILHPDGLVSDHDTSVPRACRSASRTTSGSRDYLSRHVQSLVDPSLLSRLKFLKPSARFLGTSTVDLTKLRLVILRMLSQYLAAQLAKTQPLRRSELL